MIRNTSLAAYRENETNGFHSTKRAQVFNFIVEHPGCTRNEIERGLNIKINSVSGRVNDLLKSKMVQENGCTHDPYTGKSVNRLYAVDYANVG